MFKFRFFHEHRHHSDPDTKRQLGDIEMMLKSLTHNMSNLRHQLARINEEVAGMKDEMSAEIAKIEARERDVGIVEPSGEAID